MSLSISFCIFAQLIGFISYSFKQVNTLLEIDLVSLFIMGIKILSGFLISFVSSQLNIKCFAVEISILLMVFIILSGDFDVLGIAKSN